MKNDRYVKVIAAAKLMDPSALSIDGVDISRFVRAFTVRACVGNITTLELELISGVRLEMDGVRLEVVESEPSLVT